MQLVSLGLVSDASTYVDFIKRHCLDTTHFNKDDNPDNVAGFKGTLYVPA